MAEDTKQENKKTNEEKKAAEAPKESSLGKTSEKTAKANTHQMTEGKDEKKIEQGAEKKEAKKDARKKLEGKEAIVRGKDLPLSKKHCMAICDFIRGKRIDEALPLMEKVAGMKIAVPMKGEIPHRKGRMMSGRYPVKAAGHFIKMLKQLSANAENKEVDIDKGVIECHADRASRPYKRFGSMKFKRTHVILKLVIKNKKKSKRSKK